MTDNGKLSLDRLVRYLTPIGVMAIAAAFWDMSGSVREIKTILIYQGKQRDEDRDANRREFDELKARVTRIEDTKK